jgi:DNA-binding NarL/FixJ family response regulator
LLRVCQEALANARKHARATAVELTLAFDPHAVSLTVTDNGVGFDPAQVGRHSATPESGFGLSGMAERMRQAGGHLAIDSAPGRGTRVVATLPYDTLSEPRAAAPSPASSGTIRVLIADDHPAIRAGLAALLAEQPDISVVAEADDGEEALLLAARVRPDVMLVDLRMPKLGGVETIERLAKLNLPTRAVAVTTFAQDEFVHEALRAGARGYLLKDVDARELVAAVRTVNGGGTHISPEVAGRLAASLTTPVRLTPREREVIALLGQGLADKEIAATLGTSVKTASFHVANVLSKLGAQSRADAVRIGYARGLLVE